MREIPVQQLQLEPVNAIGKEWMLITAGTEKTGFNTMTASWGHIGSLWGHGCGATSIVFVRPQRYTFEFVEKEPYYTLSFFPEEHHQKLAYLGSHSGRDEDKVSAVGLTPVFGDNFTTFKEAKLTLVCRKLYRSKLEESCFLDKQILEDFYPQRDLHYVYVGAIEKAFVKD